MYSGKYVACIYSENIRVGMAVRVTHFVTKEYVIFVSRLERRRYENIRNLNTHYKKCKLITCTFCFILSIIFRNG